MVWFGSVETTRSSDLNLTPVDFKLSLADKLMTSAE
jgi:hypothetical protein